MNHRVACFMSSFFLHKTSCILGFRFFCSRKAFRVGQKAEVTRIFGAEDVSRFAELTGDHNLIHLDSEFAKTTQFGRCVVHGTLVNGLISALHGTSLPGVGCIVVAQQIKFSSPLYVGEAVRAVVEVLSYRHGIMKCSAYCTAIERNEVVLTGETKLVVPKE